MADSPRPNIIFFTGANTITLRRDIERWRVRFIERYGEENISRLDTERLRTVDLDAELLGRSLFSPTRLVILDGIPPPKTAKKEKEEMGEDESPEDNDIERLRSVLSSVPETTFLLCIQPTPDEKDPLCRALREIAMVREYPLTDQSLLASIRERLPDMSFTVAQRLLTMTGWDPRLLESELDKLSLVDETITVMTLEREIHNNMEAPKPWDLSDPLIAGDSRRAQSVFRDMLRTQSIYPIHASMLGMLRTYLTILALHERGVDGANIGAMLDRKPNDIRKALSHMRNRPIIMKLYMDLVDAERRAKTGRGIGEGEESLTLLTEMAILSMKGR